MDLSDISREIYESGKRLENGSNKLFAYAKAMAETEREYRKALGIEILRLKDTGLQTTLIPDVARGNMAELKFKRDLAEAEYKSARNMLEAIMSQMNGLQSLLKIQKEI